MESTKLPDRIEDAIDEVIHRCGGRKAFATDLWPHKAQRDAHNLLDACLNPDRREKFSPGAVVYIARRGHDVGCHAVMQFIAAQCGYAVPQPIEPSQTDTWTTHLPGLKSWAGQAEAARAMQHLAERIERTQPGPRLATA